MRIDRRCWVAVMAVMGLASGSAAGLYDAWQHAYIVTLTAPTGVATDQANFPVLIRLTNTTFSPSIFGQANADGSDIRFSKMDGTTPLSYQIERWDNFTNVAEIWVKVDNVVGTTNGGQTQFKMYWGNAVAPPQSNGANVFGSSNGFLGAYHLNEQGNTNANGYADATGVYSGTGYSMVSGDQVAGQIAYGQNLNDGLHGKYLSIFGGTTGTGCQLNVTGVDANGAITGINGTPVSGGTGYAVGDYLLVGNSANGGQGDNGVVRVTTVSGTTVTGLSFVTCPHQGGSGGGANVATVNITAPSGAITGATVANYGTAYNVGDTLLVAGGNGDGKLLVATTNTTNGGQWGFGAKTVTILSGGSGYATANGVSTTDKNWYTTGTKATTKLGPGVTFASAPNFTFSAWAWSSGTADADVLFSLTKGTNGNCIKLKRHDANNLTVAFTTNGAETYTTSNNFPNPSTSWVHVGFTVTNTGTCAVYINGTPQAITTTPTAISTGTYYFNYLGSDYYMNPCQLFQGKINEAEISNVVRSADWMTLCYQSQQTNPTWMAFTPVATTPPVITTQPSSQSVSVGSLASFSVVATGGGLSYQWQRSNDNGSTWNPVSGGSGGTTANYSFTTILGDNNAQFRCYVSNSFGNVTSNAATLTVTCTAPSISNQPSNTSVNAGQTATFTVTAAGSSLSYQWQRNTGTWTNVGANSPTYSFTTAYPADNGAQFRCVITGACGTVTSNTATLTVVCPLATITAQPANQSTSAGNNVTFSVTATGATSYQWQRSNNSGGLWSDVGGATANTYTFATVIGDNGAWFRCKVTNSCGTATSNYATLTVSPACVPPSISVQPLTQTVPAGSNITFSVTATGDGLTYQWQYSQDGGTTWNPFTYGTGYTTSTLTFQTDGSVNGDQFRCHIIGTCGNVNSAVAVCNVCTPPSVTQDPQNQSVLAGQTASFTISAAGPSISYQWERSDDGGFTWYILPGQTGTTYSFLTAQGDDGAQFTCKVSNLCDIVFSNDAILSVCTPTAITAQPSNQNVTAGQQASFTVSAAGSGTLTYNWQYSPNGGVTWGDVPSNGNSATYSFTTSSADNNNQYRCAVANGCATPAVSNAAILSVCTPPSIATQPVGWSGVAGTVAGFSITIPGIVTSPSYQWQKSTNGGATWNNVTVGNGGTTSSYSFTTQGSDNGAQFRCQVSGACGSPATSNAAVATVCVAASITANPLDQNVIAGAGATFTVTASGGGTIFYQWQQSTDGGSTFTDIAGATSSSYGFTAAIGQNGYKYRCGAFVNGCGSTAWSSVATLSVCIPPAITANPANQSVNAGTTASFTAAASGSGTVAYQWQQSSDGGTSWTAIAGATAATYSFTANASQDQYRYRCQASNGCGSAALSSAAILTVCSQAAVSVNPSPQSVTAGAAATFSVTATGTPSIAYQWQYSTDNGTTWANVPSGGLAATYSFTAATGQNGYQYRCGVYTGCFSTAYSTAALLTVCTPPSITQQPVSQPGKQVGDQVTFTVTVPPEVSTPVNYQWKRSDDGGTTWTNAPGASTSSSYTFTVAGGDANAQFKCYITNGCGQLYSNAVNIGVCTAVAITSNPSPQNVPTGSAASFTVAATGVPAPSYQWQYSVDNGATWNNVALNGTSATYSFTAMSADNNSLYRCNVSNGCGSPAVSSAALLSVCTPPSISQQPIDPGTVIAGTPIILSVSVPAIVTTPSYQWERSPDGTTWSNAGGASATTASYTFTSASGDNGAKIRCRVYNTCGTIYSSVITLSVCTPVAIGTNPANANVTAGQNATFTVAATGSGTLIYQWDYSANNGTTWSNVLSGGTAASYIVTTASNLNGYLYRCNVSNGCGSPAVSLPATLNVCTPPSIATQPVPPPLKNVGDPVTLSVSVPAQVTSPAYQWQRSADNGTTWPNAAGASATTATYTFTAAAGDFGAQYRCAVTNGCGAITSNAVTLSVCTQAAITVQPLPQGATAGQPATFSVTATGTPLVSYQWQSSADTGKTFSNVATGGIASSYTFTTATANNAWQYRVGVSTGCGTTVYSSAAALAVCTPPSVSQPPASQTEMAGQDATFGVVVPPEVTSPSYQWQRSPDGTTWTNATGATATAASYTFTVAAGDDGARFRCAVTNGCGTVNSAVAVLTICIPPSIASGPFDQSVVAGQNAAFSVTATGSAPLSYQWQSSTDSIVWSPVPGGGALASYSFASATSQDGLYYRCVVSGNCGTPAVSRGARLRVCTPPHVVSQPGNQGKNLGDTAVFGVSCTGSLLSYQWQRSTNGVAWTNATAGTGAASATYRLVSSAPDDSARFRCMVSNGCGSDSSTAAVLSVCSPPSITAQPRDTSVVSGATAVFAVGFFGTAPQYQWQKSTNGLVWNDTAGATLPAFALVAKASDNGLKFRCYIKSKCGDVISNAATLTVCNPVTITAQTLRDTTVLAGASLSFGITATGTTPSYVWQRKASGDSLFRKIAGDTAASYSFTAQTADSAALFRCVAVAACGAPETSQTALMIVFAPLVAAFAASDSQGQTPLTVGFSDLSTGSFTQRIWDFGDSTVPDSTSKNPSHTYASAGTYTVRLTVSGPAPRGTVAAQKQIFTWKPGDNPIRIAGTYLSPQAVVITLTNYGTITPPSSFVSADSVALWYKAGAAPLAINASATFIKGYTLAQLRSRGTSYTDTLAVPAIAAPDSAYGFANVVVWTDRTKTAITAGNTASVLMKDTLPINNELIISGVYLPDDTARISLANVNLLDTSRVGSVGIWYSLSTDTVDFSDSNFTQWLPVRQVVAAGGAYSVFIVNPQFNNEKKTIWAAVELLGKNKHTSNAQTTSFVVGKDRPVNPLRLSAKALSSSRIRVSWKSVVATGIERIVIWYRTTSPVPLATDVTALNMASLNPAVYDTVIIGNKFSEKTRYFFGAQVYQNGLWSLITDSASATDTTPEAGDSLPYNSAQIKSLAFDTLINQIKVGWSVNPAQTDSLQIGILYSTDAMPKTSTGQQQVIDVTAARDSVYLAVSGSIMFDRTYYVSLWLRRANGKWTSPTPQAMDSVRVPPFRWQNVVYFSKENDTVFAFNNKVRLLNSPGDLSLTHNTVAYYAPAPVVMNGLFPASVGFTFKNTVGGFPFFVGLKVDTVPAGYTFGDVRIYHRTAAGLWVLDNNPFFADSVSRYVSVLTNQLDLPFMAMVDTMKPVVTGPGNVRDPVVPDLSISDTVIIHDNIANVTWRYKTAKGGASFASGDTSQGAMLSDTTDTIIVTIPGEFVNQDNGARAFFIVSDGIHLDTLVLSRSVIRDNCGIVRTIAMKWTPLPVSMVLDSVGAKQVLKTVAGGTAWKYDTYKFRLFRWYPDSANAGSKDKWVEYSDTMQKAFSFTRGSLLWIKTREKADVDFGRGVTPSLVDPYAMRLQPATWGDFAMPFKFDIKLGDILNATRAAGANPDTLQFYQWKRDAAGHYWSEPIFIKGIDTLNRQDTVLSSTDVAGFSVYNPSPDTVRLVIPPVPQAMSTFALPKKAAGARTGWALAINASLSDGTRLSPVYCGYSKGGSGVTYYPQPLSFVKAYAGVFDATAKQAHGHAMAHAMTSGGYAYLLAFVNESQQKEVLWYRVDNQNTLPKGIRAGVYDALTGQFENQAGAGMSVSVEPGAKEFRWLLVGTDAYLAKAVVIAKAGRLLLAGTYPNPFRSVVRIRFSLPFEGVDKVKFTIYNMLGRTLWRHEVSDCSGYGTQDLVWNARADNGQPVATGVYIVRMVALSKVGKQVGVFEKRMIMVK